MNDITLLTSSTVMTLTNKGQWSSTGDAFLSLPDLHLIFPLFTLEASCFHCLIYTSWPSFPSLLSAAEGKTRFVESQLVEFKIVW